MDLIYRETHHIDDLSIDRFGRLRPAAAMLYTQNAAAEHCGLLGVNNGALLERNIFWVIARQKTQITRLPQRGETLTLETWPMPATHTAYPRAAVALDADGNELFRTISLWVLMDIDSRTMILPGKSGVEVPGLLRGSELRAPGFLAAATADQAYTRTVAFNDLDRNGHMNNTRCMDWIFDMLPSDFHREHPVKEFTVCYQNEAWERQTLNLSYAFLEDGVLRVDAHREPTPALPHPDRVFSVLVRF